MEQINIDETVYQNLIEEPVIETPVEEAVVEEPVVEEAVIIKEEPVIEEPVIEEPVIEEPVVEEPVVEEPVVEEPVVEEPVVEEPVIEEPVIIKEEPVVEEPVIEEPVVEEPVIEEPVIEEPVIEEPVVEEPVIEEPVVEELVIEEPVIVVETPVEEKTCDSPVVPKLIFIVPYRDREQQYKFFAEHMKNVVMEDILNTDYAIYYIHQCDTREFNRGAMKNIGFIAMKEKYPNHYKDITFVFNDVDTMPYTKNFLNYETTVGTAKHFYGYDFSLGGIVSIKGADFERILGYPNFWAWGFEDNLLQQRVLEANLKIDRSQFYPIMDKNIFQMKDGLTRLVNRKEFDRYVAKTDEGWQSINSIQYTINEETGFINVDKFFTGIVESPQENKTHDLRNGSRPFALTTMPIATKRGRPTMGMRM